MPPRRRKPPRAGALTELPPLKIVRSILLLQFFYYTAAFVLILFTTIVLGQKFSLSLLFDWHSVRGDNTVGWTVGFLWVIDGFIIVIPILLLIARSKLVPDFALTIHLIHLIITSVYTKSIPTNLLWWGLEAASAALTISLGVWACRYRELQPISFGTVPKKTPANGMPDADDTLRGAAGRGRNVDSGPSYEMVNVVRGDQNV
ncbi:Integral membrane protein of the Golgi [Exophiala xenobiotica]|nr:Integral membrane protein of the Golgi [Exophiala xenobiotica]